MGIYSESIGGNYVSKSQGPDHFLIENFLIIAPAPVVKSTNPMCWCVEAGCAWDENVALRSAAVGRVDILSWALERGCPLPR
jgi:hypothetical protein